MDRQFNLIQRQLHVSDTVFSWHPFSNLAVDSSSDSSGKEPTDSTGYSSGIFLLLVLTKETFSVTGEGSTVQSYLRASSNNVHDKTKGVIVGMTVACIVLLGIIAGNSIRNSSLLNGANPTLKLVCGTSEDCKNLQEDIQLLL